MSTKSVTFAVVGNGESSPANVKSLLNDYLEGVPAKRTHVVIPITAESKFDGGFESFLDWIEEHEDIAFDVIVEEDFKARRKSTAEWIIDAAAGLHTSTDVAHDLMVYLRNNRSTSTDVDILMLYPEEGDLALQDYIDRAAMDEIPVLDLTQGLDVLSVEPEEEESEPEPEPEPEPEKPSRRLKVVETPLDEPKPHPLHDPDIAMQQEVNQKHADLKVVPAPSAPDLADLFEDMVRSQAAYWSDLLVRLNEKPTADPQVEEQPKRGRGRPRNDGQPTRTRTAKEKAVVEYWDEDDEAWVRKGRGRVPKGVKTRLVDPKTGDPVEE